MEQILRRYLPDWQSQLVQSDGYTYHGYRWQSPREGALLCRSRLQALSIVALYLEEPSPTLAAADLHPWIWEAARPSWEASSHSDAVDAAARNLNARIRVKSGRGDLGEGDLIAQLFSLKDADANNPRLRVPLPVDIGNRTSQNIHAGIIEFGKGLYQAVRNPQAHEAPGTIELSEQEALECLAAFSLLARWVDRADVLRE